MENIAVVGTGTIGLMLGASLTKGGHNVTLVSLFRPETASALSAKGITISYDMQMWRIPVRAVFASDLSPNEKFDIIFITCKSNDTEYALDRMLPHLSSSGYICSLQNGINDYIIAEKAGTERVVPCVCFAGGQVPEPCHVVTHDGYFIIGELSGEFTRRLFGLRDILSCVKHVEVTDNIMSARWHKLSEVCLTVPLATLTGWSMFEGLDDWRALRLFGRLACEIMDVQRAAGNTPSQILNFTREKWAVLADGRSASLEAEFTAANKMPPGGSGSGLKPTDAYTMDIAKGLPLEIWYTNGYVSKLGRNFGIPTPTLDSELALIRKIEAGIIKPGPELLDSILGL